MYALRNRVIKYILSTLFVQISLSFECNSYIYIVSICYLPEYVLYISCLLFFFNTEGTLNCDIFLNLIFIWLPFVYVILLQSHNFSFWWMFCLSYIYESSVVFICVKWNLLKSCNELIRFTKITSNLRTKLSGKLPLLCNSGDLTSINLSRMCSSVDYIYILTNAHT